MPKRTNKRSSTKPDHSKRGSNHSVQRTSLSRKKVMQKSASPKAPRVPRYRIKCHHGRHRRMDDQPSLSVKSSKPNVQAAPANTLCGNYSSAKFRAAKRADQGRSRQASIAKGFTAESAAPKRQGTPQGGDKDRTQARNPAIKPAQAAPRSQDQLVNLNRIPLPPISFPEELPVSGKRHGNRRRFAAASAIIVCGETGSR